MAATCVKILTRDMCPCVLMTYKISVITTWFNELGQFLLWRNLANFSELQSSVQLTSGNPYQSDYIYLNLSIQPLTLFSQKLCPEKFRNIESFVDNGYWPLLYHEHVINSEKFGKSTHVAKSFHPSSVQFFVCYQMAKHSKVHDFVCCVNFFFQIAQYSLKNSQILPF
jgi:hypothetical protein